MTIEEIAALIKGLSNTVILPKDDYEKLRKLDENVKREIAAREIICGKMLSEVTLNKRTVSFKELELLESLYE